MSTSTTPDVFLIARPTINWAEVHRYIEAVSGEEWTKRLQRDDPFGLEPDAERLIEFMGRMCYRSWAEGLNPNVRKVRQSTAAYLANILASSHGSVLEHATFSFVFHNVSRVFTHELVRHRVGTAISQESMRYVRLEDIPFEHPQFVLDDPVLRTLANDLLANTEAFLEEVVRRTGIENLNFHDKKVLTSAMRRYVPDGVATSIGWTANVRTLRNTIALRTAEGAEEEIRRVFDRVATLMVDECPILFGDFTRHSNGVWQPEHTKV